MPRDEILNNPVEEGTEEELKSDLERMMGLPITEIEFKDGKFFLNAGDAYAITLEVSDRGIASELMLTTMTHNKQN